MNIQLIDNYTDKCAVIIGNTKPIREQLKELGGRFNPFLKIEGVVTAGWVFSVKRLVALRNFVASFVVSPMPSIKEVVTAMPERVIIASLPKINFIQPKAVKELPVINNILDAFRKKAGKKYAEKYIELCQEANVCILHAIENSIMRRKLYQFRSALKFNQERNAKKEYHKPIEKEAPFIAVFDGFIQMEKKFKNSNELQKFIKTIDETRTNEQPISVTFKPC